MRRPDLPTRLSTLKISRAFQHPPTAATQALAQIPGVDQVVRKLSELQYERALRQMLLETRSRSAAAAARAVDGLRAGRRDARSAGVARPLHDLLPPCPKPWRSAPGGRSSSRRSSSRCSTPTRPGPSARARTRPGRRRPLHDHAGDPAPAAGRAPVPDPAPLPRGPGGAARAVRSAELTADRAGALACRDPLVSCRMLMVMAAGVPSSRLDLDAFLRQASEYQEWDSRV